MAADAALAHAVLVWGEVSVGLLVALLAPVAATRGPAGAALALCSGLVVLLRARRYRAGGPALACLAAGAAALAGASVTVLLAHPGARAVLGAALAAGALVLVAATSPRPAPGWHRLADLAESAGLVALPALLVTASGLLGWVAAAAARAGG